MIINLPEWKLTLCPPLYDTSSKSPIEQTAQVYGKMRELVEAFNKFTEELTKALSDHEQETIEEITNFKNEITCIMSEYITSIDSEIQLMHNHLHELEENYAKDVVEQTRAIIDKALNDGTITISEQYNEETESLYFIVTGGIT